MCLKSREARNNQSNRRIKWRLYPYPAGHEYILSSRIYNTVNIVSEYDQEIPQSQTTDKPMATRGRATQQLRDTRKTS